MDYVMLLSWHPTLTREERDAALIRRSSWTPPAGLQVKAEYWLASSDVGVVVIASAEEYAPIMEVLMTWADTFSIEVHPAISAEEGLRVGPEVMAKVRG